MARPLTKQLLLLTRTLHIYATMVALIVIMFFSFTGFMMNHGEWFSLDRPRVIDRAATMPAEVAGAKQHLVVTEWLRKNEGAHGEINYDDQEEMARVQFKSPGRIMEYTITKGTGEVAVHEEIFNTMALLADLHQGKGSGAGWRRVIDGTAIFLMFACLSGLILWISLPKRRVLGIVALVVGVGMCGGVYWWLVP